MFLTSAQDSQFVTYFWWEDTVSKGAFRAVVAIDHENVQNYLSNLKRFFASHSGDGWAESRWPARFRPFEETGPFVSADIVNAGVTERSGEIVFHTYSHYGATRFVTAQKEPQADFVALIRCPRAMLFAWLNQFLIFAEAE